MSIPMKGRRERPTGPMRTHLPPPTLPSKQDPVIAAIRDDVTNAMGQLRAERDRLRWVIDQIAESTMVRVTVLKDSTEVVWGCGVCEGEFLHRDDPQSRRGVYAHKDWCPRK